jgi:hypothetical protein
MLNLHAGISLARTGKFTHSEWIRIRGAGHKQRFEDRIERLGNAYVGRKSRGFEFPLARLVRCRCGLTLTGQQKRGTYTYYTHRCKETGEFVYQRETEIVESLDRALSRARFAPEYAESLKMFVKAIAEEQKKSGRADMEALNKRELELIEKKSRLYDLFTRSYRKSTL